MLLGRGLPPVYERPPEGVRRRPKAGRRTGASGSITMRPIVWTDLIRGEQKFDPKLLSDPVVRREDGSWLYLLPSVIDDVDLGVTHVVRGEDHVSNSAVQIQMFEALGSAAAGLRARGALVAAEGKLSKRLGSYGAEHLREEGVEPMACCSTCWRGSGRRSRSSPSPTSTSSPRISTFRPSAARRPISTRTRSS